MPIKVQSHLPAIKVLESENIFVMPEDVALRGMVVDPQFVYGYYSFHPATKEWDFQGYTDWIFAEW